jgi:hypothetical protein
MKSELLCTLEMVDALRFGPLTIGQLCAYGDCSVPTAKRRLGDARRLGAAVESLKEGSGRWVYHLGNESAIAERLGRWLELERARSLLEGE